MDEISKLIKKEEKRQRESVDLIPSENITSREVRGAVGSVLMHKYAEGYPGRRYYQGNEFVDEIENLAVERAKKLFGVPYANVQPYSGSVANAAVYMGLGVKKIMGMSLTSGGHLTHGHPKITFSGKFFESVQYGVGEDGFIDYKEVRRIAKKNKPDLIVAGVSAYSRILDWKKFSEIADEIEAKLMADISHVAGLVAGGVYPSPVKYADVITTTTHKTLRGPRGAIIMVTKKGLKKDPEMGKKIDKAAFPGLQGGPHVNNIAGIAVALDEVGNKNFRIYVKKVVENAKALADEMRNRGFEIVSGGTDTHLMLVDLRNKNVLGKDYAVALEKVGIVVNANAIPFDPNPPMNPSGIRVGTPVITTRGMGKGEMKIIAGWFEEVLKNMDNKSKLLEVEKEVKKLCERFPIDL